MSCSFTRDGGGHDNGEFLDRWIRIRKRRHTGTLFCILSALPCSFAHYPEWISPEAQSLQSPREPLPPLPIPATQVARSLLPGAIVAGMMVAVENIFFALYANLTLMGGVLSQEAQLLT